MTPFDLEIWAKTTYGEARNQSAEGKLAVSYVIKNRAEDRAGRWPDTPAMVCLQRMQFSAWNPGDPNVNAMARLESTDPVYLRCVYAALTAYLSVEPDPTDGANHYAVIGTNPYWAKGEGQKIGDHEFYTL